MLLRDLPHPILCFRSRQDHSFWSQLPEAIDKALVELPRFKPFHAGGVDLIKRRLFPCREGEKATWAESYVCVVRALPRWHFHHVLKEPRLHVPDADTPAVFQYRERLSIQ